MPFFLSKFVELYKNIPPFVEKTSFRKLWSFLVPRDKKYPCWDVTRPTPYYISYLFYIVKQKIVTIFYTVYIIKNIVYNEHRWLYIYCIKYIVYKGHTLLFSILYIVYIKHYFIYCIQYTLNIIYLVYSILYTINHWLINCKQIVNKSFDKL